MSDLNFGKPPLASASPQAASSCLRSSRTRWLPRSGGLADIGRISGQRSAIQILRSTVPGNHHSGQGVGQLVQIAAHQPHALLTQQIP